MSLRSDYAGIFPALLTPYDADGNISLPTLQKLMDFCHARGAAGFYACGSTGESLLLTQAERRTLLEGAVSFAKGKPVIAHVGATGTAEAVALAKHAKAAGASAVSAIPPVFFGYSPAEIEGYYRDIADATDLPLFIYYIPGFSGVELSLDQIRRMAEHPNIRGIKFTSTNLYKMERIRNALPDFVIFSGPDEMCVASLMMGADGAIGSTYNLYCDKYVAAFDAFCRGDIAGAQAQQRAANSLLDILFECGSVFHGLKAAFQLLDIPMGSPRKPFAPIEQRHLDIAKKLLPLL